MINQQLKKLGFTLVELLITIAIIGILASLILPRLFGPTEQSRSSEARNLLGAIRQLEEGARAGTSGSYLRLDHTSGSQNVQGCDRGNGSEQWETLGMENPNNDNNYFAYCVDSVNNDPSAGPVAFRIRAVRKNIPNGAISFGQVLDMCLNQDGIWSGSYKYIPRNPSNVTCNSTPGPCC